MSKENDNIDWDKAIKECPSNYGGICAVIYGEKPCEVNVIKGKCPIVQLQQKVDETENS